MKSGNITATDARLKNALNNSVGSLISNSVNKSVKNSVDKSKIRTGILHKFYPYLDKVEVQLDNGGEVICKILHKFSGDLIDFFTPDGEEFFDENLNEPYVIPENELTCLLADISSQDSEEYVLLGYYIPNNINLISPATPGNFKISSINATDESNISFGKDGFKSSTIDENNVNEKCFDNLIIDDLILDDTTIQKIINQLDLPDTVNLSDYYTKKEINNLIPNNLSELNDDSEHRLVTDNQIEKWNSNSNINTNSGIVDVDIVSLDNTLKLIITEK